MPVTTRLYAQLDEAENEMAGIRAKGNVLRNAVADLIRAFAQDHDCSPDHALEYVDGELAELVDDAEGPSYRRKCRLENEIGDIEYADLRLSSPVVI